MQSPQLQVKAAFLNETYCTNFNTPNEDCLSSSIKCNTTDDLLKTDVAIQYF